MRHISNSTISFNPTSSSKVCLPCTNNTKNSPQNILVLREKQSEISVNSSTPSNSHLTESSCYAFKIVDTSNYLLDLPEELLRNFFYVGAPWSEISLTTFSLVCKRFKTVISNHYSNLLCDKKWTAKFKQDFNTFVEFIPFIKPYLYHENHKLKEKSLNLLLEVVTLFSNPKLIDQEYINKVSDENFIDIFKLIGDENQDPNIKSAFVEILVKNTELRNHLEKADIFVLFELSLCESEAEETFSKHPEKKLHSWYGLSNLYTRWWLK